MEILDPQLISLADAQGGAVLTRQAAVLGHSPRQLCKWVSAGLLHHPARGLYLLDSSVPEGRVDRHLQLARAGQLLYPDALCTGVTAVLAHGLPLWPAPPRRPHFLRPIRRSAAAKAFRVRPGIEERELVAGLACAPLTVALVQLAMDSGTVSGLVSADQALREGLCSEGALTHRIEAVGRKPYGSRALAMRSRLDARSESPGETRCRIVLATLGFRVTSQVEIRDAGDRLIGRVDFLIDGTNVIVEFDGKLKYASNDPEILWREKQREDALRAAGYTVVRVTWADLENPRAMAARIRRAVRAPGIPASSIAAPGQVPAMATSS
jgi:very-short-patch-repair endonuclease